MRFSIRDLLWLMAVVGLIIALWIDHRDLVAVRERAVDLRQNLEIARWYYGREGRFETPVAPPVNWNSVDERIP